MNRRKVIREKIMSRVEVIDCGHRTPCWIWQGPDSGKGRGGDYPRMNLDGGTVAVHKTFWINENGAIPPKKQLDHECNTRKCVRPSHLELVTHKKNQRRRAQRQKDKP